jgi:hypothetical protein
VCAQSELVSSSESQDEQCLCAQSNSQEEKEVEKPLRFQSRQSSRGTTSLEYRQEPRIQASQQR